jgi:hypothetical protein
MGWAYTCGGETRNAYKIFMSKLFAERLLGRPKRRGDKKMRVDINKTL